MSNNLDLSGLKRGGEISLTQQLVDLFTAAIESGELAPGEKLPTTRALAADASVNHLTAARVYRRLAELGYVTATVGRGTFVRALTPAGPEEEGDDWQTYVLPDRPVTYAEEVLGDAFRLTGQPGMLSLSAGWPSPELFPIERLAEISARVFEEEGGDAVAYSAVEGIAPLREQLAVRGREAGFATDPDEILITSGARQAIDFVARATLGPQDVAVVESPTFLGILSSLRATGARVIGVPVDSEGFDVDALERILARHEVRLVALQSSCQNPTGRDTTAERRARLAALAVERNFFVLEDAVYADLRFEGKPLRPVRESAPSHVIYVNSLSKTVGGGLRIGWIAARGPVFERLATLKLDSDFHNPTLTQHIAARYLASGSYGEELTKSLPFYRGRRDALLSALERHMPGEYTAEVPAGGHHVWMTLNRPVDERSLYAEGVRDGVSFQPGSILTPERPVRTHLRLSFPLLNPDELDEAVRRLARSIREVRRRTRHTTTMPVS